MNPRFVGAMLLIITSACIITGAIVYPVLPTQLISHWNAAGQPNGHMGKFWSVFLLPLMMLIFTGLWALLPRIDPIAKGFKNFRYVYDFLWFLIIAFLAYVYALMLGANLGWSFDMVQAIFIALGVVIAIIGALLPYIKRNWFVGIRTPWTISSDTVWDKTHKLCSTLFELAGLCIFVAAFLQRPWSFVLVIAPFAVILIVAFVYSYLLFRSEHHSA